MVIFQTVVVLVFLSAKCFQFKRDLRPYSSSYQNRFKRQYPIQGYQKYVPAGQPNVVVMSSGPNTDYGGVPSSYDAGSTVIIKMPNDVYNTRMPAYPNTMTRV